MRLHRFAFMFISTASIYPSAQADLSLDGPPLEELNMDGSDWNTDTSLFDQVPPSLSTADNLFNLIDGSSDLSLFADNPDACTDGFQPPSRIRARAGGYCAQSGEHPDGLVPGDDQLGREAALTQENINEENCPSDYYQKIFIIPVCSLYEDGMIGMSGGRLGVPTTDTGLKDVWGALSKSRFSSTFSNGALQDCGRNSIVNKRILVTPGTEAFSPCFPRRRWCCQTWLQMGQLVSVFFFDKVLLYGLSEFLQNPSNYGYGHWCVRGPAVKFVNPLDLFPP